MEEIDLLLEILDENSLNAYHRLVGIEDETILSLEIWNLEKRLKEAEKLGFKKCIIPENNKKLLKDNYKLDIIGVRNVTEALKIITKA